MTLEGTEGRTGHWEALGRDVMDGVGRCRGPGAGRSSRERDSKVAHPVPRTWASPRGPGEPGSGEGLTAWADENEPRCPGQGHGEQEGTRGTWRGSGRHPVQAARDGAGLPAGERRALSQGDCGMSPGAGGSGRHPVLCPSPSSLGTCSVRSAETPSCLSVTCLSLHIYRLLSVYLSISIICISIMYHVYHLSTTSCLYIYYSYLSSIRCHIFIYQ